MRHQVTVKYETARRATVAIDGKPTYLMERRGPDLLWHLVTKDDIVVAIDQYRHDIMGGLESGRINELSRP